MVCFSIRPGSHRDLHSFPTRRSSDLAARAHLLPRRWARRRQSRFARRDLPLPHQRQRLIASRSEEHTSNSSHVEISYAVFCLKKKKNNNITESSKLIRAHAHQTPFPF